jgi:ubiquinone/menaquinone biosynthesis C-methylase UbiE
LNNLKVINGFLSEPNASNDNAFEKLYIALRKKEGRIFSESEILRLPAAANSSPHYKEWVIRKNSFNKLCKYIKQKKYVCNILEVGCGNGWLTARLSGIANGEAIGIDINKVELKQARNVFGKIPNLRFIYGDIRSDVLSDKKFDLVVFAASIQYFESLKEIMNAALPLLTLQGEIHILDSFFYKENEIASAKQRTQKYFSEMGFPEMSQFYFHHSLDELQSFSYSVLYNPHSLMNKLLLEKNPFYWVCVKNDYL